MTILHDKFVFIHLPKTGGSFIHNYLLNKVPGSRTTGGGMRMHMRASQVKRIKDHQHKFFFGVVRNPFEWYVSLWKFCFQHRREKNPFLNVIVKEFPETLMNFYAMDGNRYFLNYDYMKKYDIGAYTCAFIWSFCDHDAVIRKGEVSILPEDIQVHKILKNETLKKDLEETFRNHIFELDEAQTKWLHGLKRINASRHDHYRTYYTSPDMIKEIMHKDRALFELYPEYKNASNCPTLC